jgi:predicted RNase H-like nuclease
MLGCERSWQFAANRKQTEDGLRCDEGNRDPRAHAGKRFVLASLGLLSRVRQVDSLFQNEDALQQRVVAYF